jgi:polysaccharide pyruvyl transferase WcaK-like protein
VQTKIITLTENATCEVHKLISGFKTELNVVLEQSIQASKDNIIIWSVPVTSQTIHCIVTLYIFASDQGFSVQLQKANGLTEQQTIFHEDFMTRGLVQRESLSQKNSLFFKENWALLLDIINITLRIPYLLKKPTPIESVGIKTALLIGMYGGEHVGDAAILGGVLFRLHNEFGTTHAELLSHRPDHTQRLLNGLQTPVSVTVHSSNNKQVTQLLKQSDALVFAGGPIMDLPRVLAKQIAVTAAARCKELPIIIDRVGVGPFKRQSSRNAARLIVKLASNLSVRTRTAAQDTIVADLNPQLLQDPAFNYLATRSKLTLLNIDDKTNVEKLLSNTTGKFRIGINLRPIRHLWSPKGENYSSEIADQFINRFAESLIEFSKTSKTPPSFIFFSMNPQEFGMSDLRIAYILHKKLGCNVDFRIWEGDPDVDGIVHLIRQLDAAIAMRFHACIFSFTQNIPTLGIDYYPGQGGKVEQLFADSKRPEDACRMDNYTTDWLINGFDRHTFSMTKSMNNRKQ